MSRILKCFIISTFFLFLFSRIDSFGQISDADMITIRNISVENSSNPRFKVREIWMTPTGIVVFFDFYDYSRRTFDIELSTGNPVSGSVTVPSTIHLEYEDPSTGEIIVCPGVSIFGVTQTDYIDLQFDSEFSSFSFGTGDNSLSVYGVAFSFSDFPYGVEKINIYESAKTQKKEIGKRRSSFNISPKGKSWIGIRINPINVHRIVSLADNYEDIVNLVNNSNIKIKGIYETLQGSMNCDYAILEKDNRILLVYAGGEISSRAIGDVVAELLPTMSDGTYKAKVYSRLKDPEQNYIFRFHEGLMTVTNGDSSEEFVMLANPQGVYDNISEPNSGIGVALNNGYIITNYHLVENSSIITASGCTTNGNLSYNANLICFDNNSDLALLQIRDESKYHNSDIPPYTVSNTINEIGDEVFIIDLSSSDGNSDRVTSTAGIISSKMGVDDNYSLYEISVSGQLHNSGAPVFNKKGQLIGLICGNQSRGNKVVYATKSNYIKMIVDTIGGDSIIPSVNKINSSSSKEHIQTISPYLYYINCSR